MPRRTKRAVVASTLLAGACGAGRSSPPPVGPTEPPAAVAVEAAPLDLAALAAAALAPDALHHDDAARRTVYTWTTAEQVAALSETPELLSRTESPIHGASYVDQVVYALARGGDPIARLLWTTPFARMRFAWHAPWATRDGWPGEQYGDHLIRITLRPEAVVLSLSTTTGAFEGRTLGGAALAPADVLAHPERIAAIYFVSDARGPLAAGVPRPRTTYRELALCNESMIESWSVGDDASRRELAREADALDALIRYLRARPSPWDVPVPDAPLLRDAWVRPAVPDATPERAFAAALAFENDHYRLDPEALAGLARRLRATPAPAPPLTVSVDGVPFARGGKPRPPPRVISRGVGSFSSSTSPTFATSATLPPTSTYATPPRRP